MNAMYQNVFIIIDKDLTKYAPEMREVLIQESAEHEKIAHRVCESLTARSPLK